MAKLVTNCWSARGMRSFSKHVSKRRPLCRAVLVSNLLYLHGDRCRMKSIKRKSTSLCLTPGKDPIRYAARTEKMATSAVVKKDTTTCEIVSNVGRLVERFPCCNEVLRDLHQSRLYLDQKHLDLQNNYQREKHSLSPGGSEVYPEILVR